MPRDADAHGVTEEQHGFPAATRTHRAGRVSERAARVMVTSPASSGCRRFSRMLRRNCGSSSRKSAPLCLRLTSPERGCAPPADEPGVAHGAVRGSERALTHERCLLADESGDRADPRRLQRLLERALGQDAGQAAAEQGLPRGGWPDKQDVVAACRPNLQGPLRGLPAVDAGEHVTRPRRRERHPAGGVRVARR